MNLWIVEQRLVTEFAPRDILSREARYMHYAMRKPYGWTTWQYVGAVHRLNELLTKLPPLFHKSQKIPTSELLVILASKVPQVHKAIMIEQGFEPQMATIQQFVKISERAKTKEALSQSKQVKSIGSDSNSNDEEHDTSRRKDKKSKKARKESSYTKRQKHFCKHHGPSPTLLNEIPEWRPSCGYPVCV
jgi:hypothetical protein